MLKQRLIRDTAILGSCTLFAKLMGILRGFIIPRLVTPEIYGLYRLLSLIQEYTSLGHLGLTLAIDKQIPFFRGRGDLESVQKAKNSTFSYILYSSCIILLLLILSTLFYTSREYKQDYSLGIWIVAITIPFLLFFQFISTLLRTENRFKLLSWATLLFSGSSLVTAIILGKYFKAIGLILSVLISYLIMDWMLFYKSNYSFSLKIDRKMSKVLFKIGIPLLATSIFYQLLLTLDSLLVVRMLPGVYFGYYGIAVMISRSIYELPFVIISILFPRLSERFGQTGNVWELEKLVNPPLILISLLMPFIIGILIFLSEIFIFHIIPKYQPSFIPSLYLLMAAFFLSITLVSYQMFITIGKINFLIKLYAFILPIELILCACALISGYGINGTALAMMISYAIMSIVITLYSHSYFRDTWNSRFLFVLKLFLPFFYSIVFVWQIRYWLPLKSNLFGDILVSMERGCVFLIISIPLFIYANKKTQLFSIFKDILYQKFKSG